MREAVPGQQSHAAEAAAFELAPIGIVMIDRSGAIRMFNRTAERMFGYPRSEVLGRAIELLIPQRLEESHHTAREAYIKQPIARAMGAGRELFGRHRNGVEFPVEVGLTPVAINGESCVLSTVVDITERKRFEQLFPRVVESSPNAIVIVNREGRIVLANSKAVEMFGYDRGTMTTMSVDALVPDRFKEAHPKYREHFFSDPTAREMGAGRDLYALRADGSEFPVEIGLSPIETAEGVLVMAAIIDITERKRGEHTLLAAAQDLARSNGDLEQFAYAVSHDLQEPLRTVAGFLQLFDQRMGPDLPEDARRYINYAIDGAKQMRGLIEGILTFSRVQTRQRELHAINLALPVSEALANLHQAIEEAQAEISLGDLPTVHVDRDQMVLLFQNLISNGIKFRRTETPRIEVSAQSHGRYVEIAVKDNGIGIAAKHAERVFMLFQRLHTRESYPGSGVGLAIVKRIVERHGGSIRLEPDAAPGACFVIRLPFHPQRL